MTPSKEEFVQKILELQRIRKHNSIVSEADIYAIQNTQKVRRRNGYRKRKGQAKEW